MARDKGTLASTDGTDIVNYPNKRIKDNTGPGDGTPVDEFVYGDIHEMIAKIMRMYGISYNGLPDNESNGYQLVDALIALASKNDFVLDLTVLGASLSVPIKMGKLKNNESFMLKAGVDKGAQTNIKGIDGVNKTITYLGDFKANEYVRMVYTTNTVVLIRMVDSFNIESILNDAGFLTAATLAQSLTGQIDTVAETPLSAFTTFIARVNGAESGNFLATPAVNGLMSSAYAQQLENLEDPAEAVKVTSATSITVTAWQDNANNSDNFNFNYVDVTPPPGKTMASLQGFFASHSKLRFDGNVNDDDIIWCKWQVQATKVRVICGGTELEEAPKVNWMAIWI